MIREPREIAWVAYAPGILFVALPGLGSRFPNFGGGSGAAAMDRAAYPAC